MTEPKRMLETMMTIRAFEERNRANQAAGKSAGTCTSVGQEASAVGVVAALSPDDQILTNHRSAGHLLARGADPAKIFAEIAGRATGYCGGKSGTLHVSVKELGVILTSTIVGGELSLATGVGMSRQMLGGDGIVVCFFGDGAACEGVFHEALNLAATWNLPILFVCENNQWQAYVRRDETMTVEKIAEWASRYRMPAETVDGNDVEAVLAAATKAVDTVRKTRKPYFLETYTYRAWGHFEPDDQSYVDAEELAGWKKKDPIDALRARLLDRNELTEAEVTEMAARVAAKIEAAAEFAANSPFPAAEEVLTHVYA